MESKRSRLAPPPARHRPLQETPPHPKSAKDQRKPQFCRRGRALRLPCWMQTRPAAGVVPCTDPLAHPQNTKDQRKPQFFRLDRRKASPYGGYVAPNACREAFWASVSPLMPVMLSRS
jgi:hypothetical protein